MFKSLSLMLFIFLWFSYVNIFFLLFLSCIRETVTDNFKNVEFQTEVMLQEDLNTQKTEYSPMVIVQFVYACNKICMKTVALF